MSAPRCAAALCLLVALAAACNRTDGDSTTDAAGTSALADRSAQAVGAADGTTGTRPGAAAGPESDAALASPALPRVVFLGDSLTAGYGLSAYQAYPAVLGRLLEAEGTPIQAVNAGVSGDTTAGGLARVAWTLREPADVVVLCLGGNDGLRGQPPANMQANLAQIIRKVQATGARVLLVGVPLPANYGSDYTRAFDAIYPALAEELGVPLVPSLLEGVGGHPELNQADGIHPTSRGQELAAGNVLPALRALLAGHE